MVIYSQWAVDFILSEVVLSYRIMRHHKSFYACPKPSLDRGAGALKIQYLKMTEENVET